jgi:hypothetical protein
MHSCNDLYGQHGVVWHCEKEPHTVGVHAAGRGHVTWPQHGTDGTRWVVRRPGAFLWHRIETSKRTACGLGIDNLNLTTLRGRTLARPPADGIVCPVCVSAMSATYIGTPAVAA